LVDVDFSGVGDALAGSASYISIAQWFDKRKGKAMALSSLGAGFGSVCLVPLITLLVEQYGYFGTMLIVGSLLLHDCVGGALYRPPPVTPARRLLLDMSMDDEEPLIETELSGEVILF